MGLIGTPTCAVATTERWPRTRILFLVAGLVTSLSVGLGALVSPWFLLVTALVGANQLLFVVAGFCPLTLLLDRFEGRPTGRASSHIPV